MHRTYRASAGMCYAVKVAMNVICCRGLYDINEQ